MTDRLIVSTQHQSSPASVVRRMSRMAAVTVALCLVAALGAQTNTFPASGNVGIGTTSPARTLQLAASGQPGLALTETSGVSGEQSMGLVYDGGGVVTGGGIVWQAFTDSGAFSANLSTFFHNGSVNFGGIASPAFPGQVVFTGGNVGIGTTNPQYLLSVKGTIGAQEVIVTTTGWSDYVLQPTYRLRPLTEVAAYIQENHHLPDIPTEAEVKEKGVSLGDMQSKLLAKVEELTLHMIELQQENSQLKQSVNTLAASLAAISNDTPDGRRKP